MRMGDRTPRRSSRARLMRVSATEVKLGGIPKKIGDGKRAEASLNQRPRCDGRPYRDNYPETDSRTFHIVDCTGPILPHSRRAHSQRSVIVLQSS